MGIGWTHLFDWSVASVSQPFEIYHRRHRLRIIAYQVVVQYNYHGQRVEYFPVGDYGMFINTQVQAYNQAVEFYKRMRARIRNRNK